MCRLLLLLLRLVLLVGWQRLLPLLLGCAAGLRGRGTLRLARFAAMACLERPQP